MLKNINFTEGKFDQIISFIRIEFSIKLSIICEFD
jgi:hypothetical protein